MGFSCFPSIKTGRDISGPRLGPCSFKLELASSMAGPGQQGTSRKCKSGVGEGLDLWTLGRGPQEHDTDLTNLHDRACVLRRCGWGGGGGPFSSDDIFFWKESHRRHDFKVFKVVRQPHVSRSLWRVPCCDTHWSATCSTRLKPCSKNQTTPFQQAKACPAKKRRRKD